MTNPLRNDASDGACTPFTIARVEAFVLRCPVAVPVRTSFGTMHDRPAVFVRVEASDGVVGWGEAWCNFPACGAEHRARLVESLLAPMLERQAFDSPFAAFERMSSATAVLAIQSGEPGPLAQAIAGVDIALWDLVSRRAGVPLWRRLGGTSDRIEVYASGINPVDPEQTVAEKRAEGYRAFKLKVGFGAKRDLAHLGAVRDAAGTEARVMLDANQAWHLDAALSIVPQLALHDVEWLEEPLRADRPAAEWQRLANACRIPLAAGENAIGAAAFESLIDGGSIAVVQPDVAKWGGLSGVLPLIDRIAAAGRRYCPHYLGGGIGLLASAHLLAARGRSGGLLEVDANENPLRTELAPALSRIEDGCAALGEAPGLGVEPDIAMLREACEAAATSDRRR